MARQADTVQTDDQSLETSLAGAVAPYAIAVDVGSSSCRTVVFDQLGRTVIGHDAQISYEADSEEDGQATYDPSALLQAADNCLDQTINVLGPAIDQVGVIGFSCFWHSLIGLDVNAQPATPVFHLADTRSARHTDEIRARLTQEEWRRRTGTVFHSSYWSAKLTWLSDQTDYPIDNVRTWVSAGDYLYSAWTGETLTSLSMASGTGLCDLVTGDWCLDLLRVLNIDAELLPKIVDRDHHATLVTPYRERWPALADVPWTPALGDGACANVGSGATDATRIAMTLGTTGAVRVVDRNPVGEPCSLHPGLWAYRLDRQSVLHGAAITNGGLWFDWSREHFQVGETDILEQALLQPPAQHGLTVLPFVSGERAPIWNDHARAAIVGISTSTSNVDIVRASLEAVAHRLGLIYADATAAAETPHAVVANGGALLKSDPIAQIVTDVIAHDILALPSELEASARGAGILALETLLGAGESRPFLDPAQNARVFQPDPENSTRYQVERDRQERLRHLLYPGHRSWEIETE